MSLLDDLSQDQLAAMLGTDRPEDFPDSAEREHPDVLSVVWPVPGDTGDKNNIYKNIPMKIPQHLIEKMSQEGVWQGSANKLSPTHRSWTAIESVAEHSWKSPETDNGAFSITPKRPMELFSEKNLGPPAGKIIRQRRSAVSFDQVTRISSETFFKMLQRLMPHVDVERTERLMPWDMWPYDPAIHLLIFVHRVDGLAPGIYFLARDETRIGFLKENLTSEISWSRLPEIPEDLPLFLVQEGDVRDLAARVSCTQEIAGDSAFSFGMLAEFSDRLQEKGAWFYPRLFWESGILGQVMYLEAENFGVRGTGIGCFFDDPVHEILGVKGEALQSLYHFTVGGPVEDTRLTTLPPYFHLKHE
jgi:hypothetical protein